MAAGAVEAGGTAGGASIIAAAAAVGSSETRFPVPQGRGRWGGCWGGFSCFGSQKRAKRIVPSSRIPDGNATLNRGNGSQPAGMSNQTAAMNLSLLAPPSSPASFTNSALPSTVQSPSCFHSMSANSPGDLSSTMFATGPYAHETQLVSPPVFSTYTTEPSTAPLTPPPELAHLTTPSSPDVPFARYLLSSLDFKTAAKGNGLHYGSTGYAANDLQATYPLYPESPASSLISPISGTPRTGMSSPFPEREVLTQWDSLASAQGSRSRSPKQISSDSSTPKNFMLSPDSSFFYPARSAQFYLDQAQQSYPSYPSCGGRLSISRETDHSIGGNQHNKGWKQDVEEIEAYRASFGFSADEIITTPSYVEITDVVDISFAVPPLPSDNKPSINNREKDTTWPVLLDSKYSKLTPKHDMDVVGQKSPDPGDGFTGHKHPFLSGEFPLLNGNHHATTDRILSSKFRDARGSRSFHLGLSSSDAEIDYRRSRSSKDASKML